MTNIAEVPRTSDVQPGYSPKPTPLPVLADPKPSDSLEPDTQSPNAKMDGPDLSQGMPFNPDHNEFSYSDDGIVTFAK